LYDIYIMKLFCKSILVIVETDLVVKIQGVFVSFLDEQSMFEYMHLHGKQLEQFINPIKLTVNTVIISRFLTKIVIMICLCCLSERQSHKKNVTQSTVTV
jgi:hypothetical protein